MKKAVISISLFVLVAGKGEVLAAAVPHVVSEFSVNTYTLGSQHDAAVATDQLGNFILVWESDQDGDLGGVFAKRFDSNGNPNGTEFQINIYTENDQGSADVASAPDGSFVVVWSSYGQDGLEWGTFGRRYDSSGSALATEFQINTYTNETQVSPRIAMDPTGRFVVVWRADYQDGSSTGVFAQRFDSAGNPEGTEFQVNEFTPSSQFQQRVAIDDDGDFVVVWHSDAPARTMARRYDSSGNSTAGPLQVNTMALSGQATPAVGMASTGDTFVVWEQEGGDGSSLGIFGRRFDSLGNLVGDEFQVNTYTLGSQERARVAAVPSGEFVVAWSSDQDGDGLGIFAQPFDSAGSAIGSELQVNQFTIGTQINPAVASETGSGFIVAWESFGQDGSYEGVFGQLIHCGNGKVEPGEQCDDGSDNGTGNSCCEANCKRKPNGPASCDGNACTRPDYCASGVCGPGVCADGQACTICGGTCADTGSACECQ